MAITPWILFLILVIFLLSLDLGVFNRKTHVIGTSEALKWTLFWIGLALLFSVAIYFMYENHWWGIGRHDGADDDGITATTNYITGYLIEKALSLDNIAVIAMVFAAFRVPLEFQHRVLFWGILGALIFRGIMIGIGAVAIAQFSWVLWIFGAFLIFIAFKTTFAGDHDDSNPQDNVLLKVAKKFMPVTEKIEGMHFFLKIDGKWLMTPLFLALIVVESSDIVFAVDSIPAIFAITTDPFIVFTSNIFAILGLRSLYFVLASILEKFRFLKYAIGLILAYVGVKLLIPAAYALYNLAFDTQHVAFHLPNWSSLSVVAGSIFISIVASILYDKQSRKV
ncbi:MAG: TerC family protein [Bradymonadales bacterium]|jgi:tellurite resistance protein TerC